MSSDNIQYVSQPMPVGINGPIGYPGQMSDTIASMRWESDPLVHQLYRMLGGYEITINEKNELVRQRNAANVMPLMNDVGIERMIALIRGVVNPVTALTNVDDEEANEMIRQILYQLVLDLSMNQGRWGVHDGDKGTIMSIMKSIIFSQGKRSVGGHEASNFRTQTFEQNMSQNLQSSNSGGWSLMPKWGSSNKR